jgi:hypothetical protein
METQVSLDQNLREILDNISYRFNLPTSGVWLITLIQISMLIIPISILWIVGSIPFRLFLNDVTSNSNLISKYDVWDVILLIAFCYPLYLGIRLIKICINLLINTYIVRKNYTKIIKEGVLLPVNSISSFQKGDQTVFHYSFNNLNSILIERKYVSKRKLLSYDDASVLYLDDKLNLLIF